MLDTDRGALVPCIHVTNVLWSNGSLDFTTARWRCHALSPWRSMWSLKVSGNVSGSSHSVQSGSGNSTTGLGAVPRLRRCGGGEAVGKLSFADPGLGRAFLGLPLMRVDDSCFAALARGGTLFSLTGEGASFCFLAFGPMKRVIESMPGSSTLPAAASASASTPDATAISFQSGRPPARGGSTASLMSPRR